MNFYNYCWIFLLLLYSSLETNAQSIAASYKLPFEKTYLHTDKDVYAQGDTLWFKAYLVNAQDNKPANSSGTLYVELIAPDSAKILNREIIRMDNGLGNGDMELADTLKPGSYRLRAYTNWMRNFGDNFVFEKNITILNTQAVPATPDPKIVVKSKKSAKNKTAAATATATVTPSPAATINKLPIVRFYPEGGSLVNGISSLVAVKAEDGYGLGIPVSGSVLSSTGDTVSHFSCDSLGMGLFAMLPIAGQHYQAVANPVAGGLAFRPGLVFELPSALNKGMALQVKQTDSVIHATIRAAAISDSTLSMTLKHNGKTILSQSLNLKDAQLTFRISTATLPEGISAITIYDKEGKPECERLVYIHHPNNKSTISIFTNKKTYQPKEKVNVQIDAPANSNLSMAVVDAGIVPEQADDIVSYLQLQSEVKGNIENARRYFDTTNVNRFKQLDLLLMTQGWRDFVWRRLADTAIRISYAAENGITVSGRVRDEVLNKWLAGLNLTLYAPGSKTLKLYDGQSDVSGRFSFGNLELYGKQTVTLSAVNEKGQKKGSFMVDTLLPMPVPKQPARYQSAAPIAADSLTAIAIEKRITSMQNAKIGGVTRLKEVNIAAKRSMLTRNGSVLTSWGPDQLFDIKPEDEQYKTLEWYILQHAKGAVKGSFYYQKGVGYTTTPKNDPTLPPGLPVTGLFFFGSDTLKRVIPGSIILWQSKTTLIPPNLIVNGQELYMDDYDQAEAYRNIYFNMAITKFKKIVIKHMIGNLHGLGIPVGAQNISVDRFFIYLTLKDNALIDNPGSTNADVEGYYEARNFYKPLPNARPSINDYRTTIDWEPDIKTDANGKATISFYNAVPQTDIRVVVQGVTNNSQPLFSTSSYDLK
jgi:hypothetical protein